MKTSLDHLPENKQANIQTIVDIIQDEFEQTIGFANGKKKHSRIILIILFGSYGKGTWVDDPENGYISEEGIQLYQYQGAQLAEPGKLSPQEAKAIAEKHFGQWFESANEFFDTFQDDMKKQRLKKAAFELHQATERYLACILLVFTNYLLKSHNLKLLNNFAIQQSEDIKTVFPEDSKFHRRCFELLKRAYVDARYSEYYKITEEELIWLDERIKRLQLLTEKLCKQQIAKF